MARTETVAKGLSEGAGIIENQGRRNLKRSPINSPSKTAKSSGRPLVNSFTRKVRKKDAIAYAAFKRPGGNVAHLMDKGTKDRYTKKGAFRGRVKPYLFWTNAFNQKKQKALETIVESIEISIKKIVNR